MRVSQLKSKQPGYYEIELEPGRPGYGSITYNCPCGCEGGGRVLPLVPPHVNNEKFTGGWGWDGNVVRPTLTPSVRHLSGCKAHFNLNGGVYQMHGDGPQAAANIYNGGQPAQPAQSAAPPPLPPTAEEIQAALQADSERAQAIVQHMPKSTMPWALAHPKHRSPHGAEPLLPGQQDAQAGQGLDIGPAEVPQQI